MLFRDYVPFRLWWILLEDLVIWGEYYLCVNIKKQYAVIKELVDHHGNKKRAAIKLGIPIRQLNRRIRQYQEKGKAAFVHGNSGRKPVNCLSTEINNKIVTLYQTKYQDFNFMHFTQFLNEFEGINVYYSTVYQLLSQAEVDSPLKFKRLLVETALRQNIGLSILKLLKPKPSKPLISA